MKSHRFTPGVYRVTTDERVDGYCRPAGKYPVGSILIQSDLPPKRALVIAVHEAVHAERPELSEEVVEAMGENIGSFLWRLGYRKEAR